MLELVDYFIIIKILVALLLVCILFYLLYDIFFSKRHLKKEDLHYRENSSFSKPLESLSLPKVTKGEFIPSFLTESTIETPSPKKETLVNADEIQNDDSFTFELWFNQTTREPKKRKIAEEELVYPYKRYEYTYFGVQDPPALDFFLDQFPPDEAELLFAEANTLYSEMEQENEKHFRKESRLKKARIIHSHQNNVRAKRDAEYAKQLSIWKCNMRLREAFAEHNPWFFRKGNTDFQNFVTGVCFYVPDDLEQEYLLTQVKICASRATKKNRVKVRRAFKKHFQKYLDQP